MAGSKDLAGNDRIQGEAPDIGAYETAAGVFGDILRTVSFNTER